MLRVNKPINDFTEVIIPPNTLILEAKGVELKSLKGLPEGIIDLRISENILTDLNYMPSTVESVDVSRNKLKFLKGISKNVKNLRCSSNLLTSTDDLPDGLLTLGISYNGLTEVSNLPKGLTTLVAVSNRITKVSLSDHPTLMDKIYLSYNLLESVNGLPKAKVIDISCNMIKMIRSVDFCDGLVELNVQNNRNLLLVSYPESVKILRCSDCDLYDVPVSEGLQTLECSKNKISGSTIKTIHDRFPDLEIYD